MVLDFKFSNLGRHLSMLQIHSYNHLLALKHNKDVQAHQSAIMSFSNLINPKPFFTTATASSLQHKITNNPQQVVKTIRNGPA